MYLIVKQRLNHLTSDEFLILKELCHIVKNLRNQTIYEIETEYKKTGKHLTAYDVMGILQGTENYSLLNSGISQQTILEVDWNYKSYFSLIKSGQKANPPKYLKKDGYYRLTIRKNIIQNDKFIIPYSRKYKKEHKSIEIKVPSIVQQKNVRQIVIQPMYDANVFYVFYIYKEQENVSHSIHENVLAIDIGMNNFCTCVSTFGDSFIIDGYKLKSLCQWCCKENARLQSIKDKQNIKGLTKKQINLFEKMKNQLTDYVHKTSKIIINYCLEHDIDTLVFGMNDDFQRYSNMGKKVNQLFTRFPFGKLRDNLEYLCKKWGILFIVQNESYTSKASFLDGDVIYDSNEKNIFSGKRIKRGLYRTKNNIYINADLNAALNIMKKSNVVSDEKIQALCDSGFLKTPSRIRIY